MHNIVIPFSKAQFDMLLLNDDDWLLALQGYCGQIKFHYPKHLLVEFFRDTAVIFPTKCSLQPLAIALTIFTDGSSNGKSVVFMPGQKPIVQEGPSPSAQQAELNAVISTFQTYLQPFNLYTDSKYVVSLFPAIETALLLGKSHILPLLQTLQLLIHQRTSPFFIGHIRSHTGLPGPLSFGNQCADALTRALFYLLPRLSVLTLCITKMPPLCVTCLN